MKRTLMSFIVSVFSFGATVAVAQIEPISVSTQFKDGKIQGGVLYRSCSLELKRFKYEDSRIDFDRVSLVIGGTSYSFRLKDLKPVDGVAEVTDYLMYDPGSFADWHTFIGPPILAYAQAFKLKVYFDREDVTAFTLKGYNVVSRTWVCNFY